MDLVDEQDIALLEGGQDRGEIAGSLDRRTARVADVHPELAGDDRGERRLAESGRTVEEDVIRRLSPALRRAQEHGQVRLHLALADVFVQRSRPERALDDLVRVVDEVRSEDPREVVRHRAESTTAERLSHGCSNAPVTSVRSPLGRLTSGAGHAESPLRG